MPQDNLLFDIPVIGGALNLAAALVRLATVLLDHRSRTTRSR